MARRQARGKTEGSSRSAHAAGELAAAKVKPLSSLGRSSYLNQQFSKGLRCMTKTYRIKNLPFLTIEAAQGKARSLLEGAQKKFGFIPNMYRAMANEPALFETYMSSYDLFRQECGFSPVEQEVIFLTISRANACEYCVAAHSFVADKMSKVPTDITDAIRDGRAVSDPKLETLREFTSRMVASRGRPSESEVNAFLGAGYSERSILGIILAISVKTLSNYTNHIFDTEPDAMFASRAWQEEAA